MPVTRRVDEKLVVAIWERRAVARDILEGLKLEVVYPGVPSDAGGPDYQDALLLWRGRELVGGDVEFHVCASDWYRHGHDENPRYNRVVLHVVWQDDAACTVRADGHIVPTLELRSMAPSAPPATSQIRPPPLAPPACASACAGLTSGEARERIQRAGMLRFHERGEHLEVEMTAAAPDQVAYTAMLEAMGYASNRDAFRLLADAVPYAWLRTVPGRAWDSALLSAAGLMASSGVDPPAHLDPRVWRLARLRPGNHPARRLQGVSVLLQRFGSRLAEGLASGVLASRRRAQLRALFTARHETEVLIGVGRADELVASMALPLVYVLSEHDPSVEAMYQAYYSPPSTRWTRAMTDLLGPAGYSFKPRTAVEHQGLHLIYTRHCRRDRRAGCPLCGDLEG